VCLTLFANATSVLRLREPKVAHRLEPFSEGYPMKRVDTVSDLSTLRTPEQPGSPRESMKKHLLGKIIFFNYWRGTFLREKYQGIYDFTNLELFS